MRNGDNGGSPLGPAIRVGGAVVQVWAHRVVSTYADGSRSEFWPPTSDREYLDCCEVHGFGRNDAMRFGLEHDVLHHVVGEMLLAGRSEVVWAQAHGATKDAFAADKARPDSEWPMRFRDEEHLVNALMRWMHHKDVLPDPTLVMACERAAVSLDALVLRARGVCAETRVTLI